MTHYVGILDGANNVWGVRLPDLPGCYGGGPSRKEAIADATSAMHEWAEARMAKQLPMPNPRAVSDLLLSGEIDATDVDFVVIEGHR